jgi:hypothetical protein
LSEEWLPVVISNTQIQVVATWCGQKELLRWRLVGGWAKTKMVSGSGSGGGARGGSG